MHKTTGEEGWDPSRLVILMLITLILVLNMQLCELKTTGDVWDPEEICYSGSKMSPFCNAKTTDEGWDP